MLGMSPVILMKRIGAQDALRGVSLPFFPKNTKGQEVTASSRHIEQPVQPSLSLSCEFEKELLLMTRMRNVPNSPWDMMPIGSWHGFLPKAVIISVKCLFLAGLVGGKWTNCRYYQWDGVVQPGYAVLLCG
jgi:hypothetical protein